MTHHAPTRRSAYLLSWSPPCPPRRPINRRRGEGGGLMAMLDMLMTASRHADAWIEPRVEQVAQQREDCEEGGEYYDHCLDRGNVPPRDRFPSQEIGRAHV